jgi:hypothetical protein
MTTPTPTTVFVTIDADGDKLAVEFFPEDERGGAQYVVTVSGEDGHRAVVLDAADVEDLISTLRHHRGPLLPVKDVRRSAKRAAARRRPVGDGLDGLRGLLP